MEGTKVGAVDAQRTGSDAVGRIGDADDFQQGEGGRVALQDKSAIEAALGGHHAGAAEGLEDLAQVTRGDFRDLGNLVGVCDWPEAPARQTTARRQYSAVCEINRVSKDIFTLVSRLPCGMVLFKTFLSVYQDFREERSLCPISGYG